MAATGTIIAQLITVLTTINAVTPAITIIITITAAITIIINSTTKMCCGSSKDITSTKRRIQKQVVVL